MSIKLKNGRYEITEILGHGSFGLVCKAKDLELGREVALKIFRTPPDGEAEIWFLLNSRPESREQFIADVEQQCRELGLPVPFVRQQSFGDVFACQLSRKK